MNTKKNTPPEPKTVIFRYDEQKFAKTIARLTKALMSDIKVAVWAMEEDDTGKCINVLDSKLSGEEFDALAKKALYTSYKGTPAALREIGVS